MGQTNDGRLSGATFSNNNNNSERQAVRVLDPVDFHGQALVVLDRAGQPYVAMKPVVEGMGLDWKSQHRKLTDESDRWGMVMMGIPSAGGEQETVCLPLRKLTGWLMTLQTSRMNDDVAERVLTYQRECDDALWAYWTDGVAVNPRAEPKTPGEMFLESAQRFLDNERRMKAIEVEQARVRVEQQELAQQVGALVQRAAEGEAMILALPPPTVAVREATVRARINQLVRGHIHAYGIGPEVAGSVWARLYSEFRTRHSIDLSQRAKNRSTKAHKVIGLDIAEEMDTGERPGTMADLYAVAVELYGQPVKALAKRDKDGE